MQRDENFNQAVRNGLIAIVGVLLVVLIGSLALVKVLGLDGSDSSSKASDSPAGQVEPLPTTALPVPGEKTSEPEDTPSPTPSKKEDPAAEGLRLSITPVFVRPMERINITGTYAGMDAVDLQVQRKAGGGWEDFPTSATVRAGSFSTYVMTGRTGDNTFRVFDPAAGKASNAVTVTVQ